MKKLALLCLVCFGMIACGDDPQGPPPPPPPPPIPEGTLPVVFHVLYETESNAQQNPSQFTINTQFNKLNQFYAATLFPAAGSTAIDVTFTLATHDPNGTALAEPGIHRVQYPGSVGMNAGNFLTRESNNSVKNKPIFWNPNRYINVWIFGFSEAEATVGGISVLPYSTSGHGIPGLPTADQYLTSLPTTMWGLCLNNSYFSAGESYLTFVHEMGHYLGLFHAFGEGSKANCAAYPSDNGDDYCSDTPKYDRPAYQIHFDATIATHGNVLPPDIYNELFTRTPCDGDPVYRSTNVMDYYMSDRNKFTPEQAARVVQVMDYSPLIPRSPAAATDLVKSVSEIPLGPAPDPVIIVCPPMGPTVQVQQ